MEFLIVSWVLSIIATWAIARHNGRSDGFAVFMGILFGWLAFIVYLCIGKSFEKKLAEANALSKARGDS